MNRRIFRSLLPVATILLAAPGAAESEPVGERALGILAENCQSCHRLGGPAPFVLATARDVRAWSAAMRRSVHADQMPPWHATGPPGKFRNDRRLAPADKELLMDWLSSGAQAEPSDWEAFARGASARPSRWQIGQPDLILELPEVSLPPKGEIPYHSYVVETGLERDVWVTAAETLPGNRSVVHHIIVEALVEGRTRPGTDPRTVGSLGGYVPGDGPLIMPAGLARLLPAGAKVVFQVHYTPSGEAAVDRSQLGLRFSEEAPKAEARTGIVSTPFLWIPAGQDDVRFDAELRLTQDLVLLSMRPHMHLRGKSFRFEAILPSGESELLLEVDDYQFGWQTTYHLARPASLPAGTTLKCFATYNNSSSNPNNPAPDKDVSWGELTSDEMMIGFFEYYVDDGSFELGER